MDFNRSRADAKIIADGLVRQPASEPVQDVPFARRQRFQQNLRFGGPRRNLTRLVDTRKALIDRVEQGRFLSIAVSVRVS